MSEATWCKLSVSRSSLRLHSNSIFCRWKAKCWCTSFTNFLMNTNQELPDQYTERSSLDNTQATKALYHNDKKPVKRHRRGIPKPSLQRPFFIPPLLLVGILSLIRFPIYLDKRFGFQTQSLARRYSGFLEAESFSRFCHLHTPLAWWHLRGRKISPQRTFSSISWLKDLSFLKDLMNKGILLSWLSPHW